MGSSLVIGADGLIGRNLFERLIGLGQPVIGAGRRAGPGRIRLDLTEDLDGWRPPAGVETAYLCAAVTSLAECRRDPEQSRRVNVEQTARLAEILVGAGAFVVFISTAAVFDGSVAFQKADAARSPRTEYGRQKAEAEERLLALGAGTAVIRITKVVWPGLPVIADWRESLMKNEVIHPFHDLVLSPLPVEAVVEGLVRLGDERLAGISQMSAAGEISYADLAERLAARLGADRRLVQPISVRESGLDLEAAPRHASLDCRRLIEAWGFSPPEPAAVIDRVLSAEPGVSTGRGGRS